MKKVKTEEAWFAAGCFWHVELTFSQTSGVISTRGGYAGGITKNPRYQEVCAGMTGHAETVKVIYDPAKVSYTELLNIFWEEHDPTQVNRQGSDVGSQYRSVVFYKNNEQKKEAEISKKEQEKKLGKKIVTEIIPAREFYDAEEYHQQYLKKKGLNACPI